jgi:cyclomaltodextrinase / maltogenic alpha-amylase / neopullulanase
MKTKYLILAVPFLLIACQPALNTPPAAVDNQKLNSLMTLEVGENTIYLQDFILNVQMIDSVTSTSETLEIKLSDDKQIVKLDVLPAMEHFVDLKIWIKGYVFSVPCRKSDKIDYVFSFNPLENKYQRVQIAGQMNDWTPGNTPDLQLNESGMYEVKLKLSPGVYLYQMNLDGDQNHDANNPVKVDNGYGKYNSILQIEGEQENLPVLQTKSPDNRKINLSVSNGANQFFVYWQNYLLPDNFIRIGNGEITFDIPAEALEIQRSFMRVWASNNYGVSNDLLIPLHNGKVLQDAKFLNRHDRHAQIMYFMLVDRFKNGNPDNDKPLNRQDVHPKADYHGGDLEGLLQKIEDGYFSSLGVNTLWISPLNQNPEEPYGYYEPMDTKFSGYHGYWPVSSSKVDHRFGSNALFKKLVRDAQRKDMNVLLDYVANHVHELHPLFQQHPEYATNLYLPDGTMNVEKWDEQRLTTWFDTFMPTLDFSNPEVVDMMTDSAIYWLKEFNLDGFRHDACKHVDEAFWRTLTLKIKQNFPGKHPYQIGETYGSPRLIASYLTSGMLDGQFDFNVFDIANTTFAGVGGDLTRVWEVLQSSLQTYGHHNLMGYISGNHDKARFMAYASGDIQYGEDAKEAGWLREIGITDSIAYDKFALFHAFNLTIPGVPVLYYGDEIGMTGGNDPDSRRMMRFDGWNNREEALWNKVATLSQLRANNPVFIYGSFINLKNTPETWIYARKYFAEEAIVLINNSAKRKRVEITLPEYFQKLNYKSVFKLDFKISDKKLIIELPPYTAEVLI